MDEVCSGCCGVNRRRWCDGATLVVTVALFVLIPKGFFSVQDTGVILGITEGPRKRSRSARWRNGSRPGLACHSEKNRLWRPPRLSVWMARTRHPQQRAHVHQSETAGRSMGAPATSSDGWNHAWPDVDGITLHMQPVQDLTVEDRVSRTQFQYTLEDADPEELNRWAPETAGEFAAAAGTARCQQRSAESGAGVARGDRPQYGVTHGHHAATHHRYAVRCVRPAAGFDHVHAVESVSRHSGGDAGISERTGSLQLWRCADQCGSVGTSSPG